MDVLKVRSAEVIPANGSDVVVQEPPDPFLEPERSWRKIKKINNCKGKSLDSANV